MVEGMEDFSELREAVYGAVCTCGGAKHGGLLSQGSCPGCARQQQQQRAVDPRGRHRGEQKRRKGRRWSLRRAWRLGAATVGIVGLVFAVTTFEGSEQQQQQRVREQDTKQGLAGAPVTESTTIFESNEQKASRDGSQFLDSSSSSNNNNKNNLHVSLSNKDYGEFSAADRAMYGFSMLAEPFRETTLTVTTSEAGSSGSGIFEWVVVGLDADGLLVGPTMVDGEQGYTVKTTFTKAGQEYLVTVVEKSRLDGSIVNTFTDKIVCKYVRRELRELTAPDREKFLNALATFYRTSLEVGRAKYGEHFVNGAAVTAMHNAEAYCYHDGLQFITSHWAFNLLVERSLQMIEPSTSLAYWDFMVEAGTLGTEWPDSKIFGDGMFGSAIPNRGVKTQAQTNLSASAEMQLHVLQDGKFAFTRTVFDPHDELAGPDFETEHNGLGFVNASPNNVNSYFLLRTHSYCGMEGKVSFATCEKFISCFEDSASLWDWEVCMERGVHANMHGWMGGAWSCGGLDLEEYRQSNPHLTQELLTFVAEYVTANRWPQVKPYLEEYTTCPEEDTCLPPTTTTSAKDEETTVYDQFNPDNMAGCTCSCSLNVAELPLEEVLLLSNELLATMSKAYDGSTFVKQDPTSREYRFVSGGEVLTRAEMVSVLRMVLHLICNTGNVGHMSTGASPNDPIFWALHPIYEKAWHVLLFSSEYTDTYDMKWVDGKCNGSRLDDEQPFTPWMLQLPGEHGSVESHKKMTNRELLLVSDPRNVNVPYLYTGFDKWGTCDWDGTRV